ncbi:hypothetical protein E0Z10_g4599 [Xylaria hypoxylon]|uniref:S1-like domain-containing protein n=1 Tax=Xylaria hypoxylon TaxID=37992 RepID=A0A4Z0YIK9_9PEZI|nr:hypothetical protein E0Z10_g4599 [Xylaria hypoxylon]
MVRPKRDVHAAAEESITPPGELTPSQSVARVIKAEGNSLYSCSLPSQQTVLVELAARFRNTIWIKRGGYVLVDLTPPDETKGKVEGEIVNVVREEKEWRKRNYWPKGFAKTTYEDDEDEESTVGKMPPSDSESED